MGLLSLLGVLVILKLFCVLICLIGIFGGNKTKSPQDSKPKVEQPNVSATDLQSLQIRMADLMEQNHKLKNEIQSMKGKPSIRINKKEM